ncbi:hypothetical protein CALVIDRAFT_17446 [Calocera viscosa TUFC12733]|uniref:Uncharacterized protein n=1 Tax=Calocera viscosa (strain TUFC12733) TaxID=1330018 RepID=A0A167SBV9_CALVF|nr:hypothetical protein CALVIDRAFT_17446 [Calocera viscosa TUFC12733]
MAFTGQRIIRADSGHAHCTAFPATSSIPNRLRQPYHSRMRYLLGRAPRGHSMGGGEAMSPIWPDTGLASGSRVIISSADEYAAGLPVASTISPDMRTCISLSGCSSPLRTAKVLAVSGSAHAAAPVSPPCARLAVCDRGCAAHALACLTVVLYNHGHKVSLGPHVCPIIIEPQPRRSRMNISFFPDMRASHQSCAFRRSERPACMREPQTRSASGSHPTHVCVENHLLPFSAYPATDNHAAMLIPAQRLMAL